jgi:aminopeptidase N
MEHQSAVAYGNEYKMGYRGRDISGTGVGFTFDFIVVHESGHEWFGNSITAQDVADNWLHEGFTTYTETLFAQWINGRDAAFRYARGQWQNAQHRKPVIGHYGVHEQTSSDIYYKGAAVIHMLRMMMHDDAKFRALLRKLNKDFYHKIVTSRQVEDSISSFTGMDLEPFFNQYLRNAEMPIVRAKQDGKYISLELQGYSDALKLPVYDQDGRFICELSRKPVRIPAKDLYTLRNYMLVYIPKDGGTMPLNPGLK